MSNLQRKPVHYRPANKVYDYVMDALCTGKYRPGDYINERALAKRLGLSNVPVREGMERLIQLGWVERVAYRGAFIKKPNLEEVRDLWQLREAYELYAVETITRKITTEQLLLLKEPINRLRAINEIDSDINPVEPVRADIDFHQLLIELSGNKKMADLAKPLIFQLVSLVHGHISSSMIAQKLTKVYSQADQEIQDYISHEQVYLAIVDRDPDLAKQRLKKHLDYSYKAKVFLYELTHEIMSSS